MNIHELKFIKQINIDEIDYSNESYTKVIVANLFNAIDMMWAEIDELKKQNQELRDEINRLKGEKGKFEAKPNIKNSNEFWGKMENGTKKKWKKTSKIDKIKIDRVIEVKIDKDNIPSDSVFKGYEEKVVQEIIIKTDNVLYRLEKYYSESLNKTYIAKVPEEHKNTEFGSNLKSLCKALYYEYMVTENKITDFLKNVGIKISEGTISNILIKEKSEELTQQKGAIFSAGIKSDIYQQIDDTGMREKGENKYLTIVCNNNYSAYFINDNKNRETVKKMLYTTKDDKPEFNILVSDDAPQFENVVEERALCWVHEERHYKKLIPITLHHKYLTMIVRTKIWEYYKELKKYKDNPTEEKKLELDEKFDVIFSVKTGYLALDERLELTMKKKRDLLVVLEHPQTPLHNNLSENGLRNVVIKRKISGGTRTPKGSIAWENHLTILGTCKKQAINFFEFIKSFYSNDWDIKKIPALILKSS